MPSAGWRAASRRVVCETGPDPNMVSCAGLVPVMALAERAGLHDLVAAHVRVAGSAGSNPAVKVQ